MSLTRRVTDFISVDAGGGGGRSVFVTAAVATAVIAAALGYSPRAGAGSCDPGEIHLENHTEHENHDQKFYNDHNEHVNDHDHRCDLA